MLELPQRARAARFAIGLAVLGAIGAGASVADAALGTSSTLVTTARPDLVSVTTPGSQGGPTADFCFSKGLGVAGSAGPDDFSLGGYDGGDLEPASSIAQITNFCIEATFGNDAADDLVAYTHGQVAEGAVEADAGGGENLSDSAALNGSATNNGTRGFTIGPDLQTVQIRPSQNQIAYVFDQEVVDPVNDGTGFTYVDQAGVVHPSASALVSSIPGEGRERVVIAQFAAADDVTEAVIASAEPGTVESRQHSASADLNHRFAVTVPDTTGDTTDPDLVSADLVAGGDSDQMLFTYNNQIDPGDETRCEAVMSNGDTVAADNVLVTGPNTLQVEFESQFSNVSELVVGRATAAVASSMRTATRPRPRALKPAGGNVGAQATGYSTGPDAQALLINRNNDTVTIRLDQRIDPADVRLERIFLVGPNGASITSPSQVTVPTQGPGPQSVTLRLRCFGDPRGDGRDQARPQRPADLRRPIWVRQRGQSDPGLRPLASQPVAASRESARNEDAQAARSCYATTGRVPLGPRDIAGPWGLGKEVPDELAPRTRRRHASW